MFIFRCLVCFVKIDLPEGVRRLHNNYGLHANQPVGYTIFTAKNVSIPLFVKLDLNSRFFYAKSRLSFEHTLLIFLLTDPLVYHYVRERLSSNLKKLSYNWNNLFRCIMF